MRDRPIPAAEVIRAHVRDCILSGAENIKISGGDRTVVGADFTDPETDADGHYVVNRRILIGLGGYAIVRHAEDGDETAYLARGGDVAFQDFVATVPSPEWWTSYLISVNELYRAVESLVRKRPGVSARGFRHKLNEIAASTEEEYRSEWRPDIREASSALTAACDKRRPYCSTLSLCLPSEPDAPSRVVFGLKIGQEDEVLYQLTHEGGTQTYLYLNGLRTFPETYAQDIDSAYMDEWARLGALWAAEDLLAIHRASHSLVDAYMDAFCWTPYDLGKAQERITDLVRHGPAGHSPRIDSVVGVDGELRAARDAFLGTVRQGLEEPVRAMLEGDASALDALTKGPEIEFLPGSEDWIEADEL